MFVNEPELNKKDPFYKSFLKFEVNDHISDKWDKEEKPAILNETKELSKKEESELLGSFDNTTKNPTPLENSQVFVKEVIAKPIAKKPPRPDRIYE